MRVLAIRKGFFEWHIDAKVIAENRAKHYAKDDPDTSYDEEYQHTLNSDCEIADWYFNNMNWDDVPVIAKWLVKEPAPMNPDCEELKDFDSDHEVIEV